MQRKYIVVIGGGAAGTAAAYRLTELGYEVTIVEEGSRLGGRIHSRLVQGVSYETGASFITDSSYPKTFELLDELGLRQDLRRRRSHSAVFRSGQPRDAKSLLGSGWLSFGAKTVLITKFAKLLFSSRQLNLKNMRGAESLDTLSVAEASTTKSQLELMEYLFQPVLNGYFYWKPERTSMAMLMILLNTARQRSKTYALTNGLQQIPERLAEGSAVLLNSRVRNVRRGANGFELEIEGGGVAQLIKADGIVCATTATVAAKILPQLSPKLTSFLAGITYSSTAVAVRAYTRSHLTPHFALAYPRLEDGDIATINSESAIGDDDTVVEVLKAYGSGEVGDQLNAATEDEVMKKLHGGDDATNKAPFETNVQYWREALPEFSVGHITKLAAFNDGELEPRNEKLVLAGDYLGGPYIEGAITSGLQAADRLHLQF